MDQRSELLRVTMLDTGTSQSTLARLSGVRQPSISQVLNGRIDISDAQLSRLLECMGYRLEVTRRAAHAQLTRAERRSWLLHRELAAMLDEATFAEWRPRLVSNVGRVRKGVRGGTHVRNVDRWRELIEASNIGGLRRVLTGLDQASIAMREVTPFSGLLPEDRRRAALQKARG